jgi:hypothetical protein
MPSDRVRLALDAFKEPIGGFRAALRTTANEVRRHLATSQSTWEEVVARCRAELGPLADGRVDVGRFAAVFGDHHETDRAAVQTMQGALAALDALAARGDDLFVGSVSGDRSLYDTVERALAEIGTVFSAVRLVAEVRAGRVGSGEGALTPTPLPFSRWTKSERRLAPPLIVSVAGSDLRAAAIAEFLDGGQKLVLVVDGECAPAPLARLIAPGTFVVQTDGGGLDRLVAWNGPGIAALVPESAARFVHDPAAGRSTADRLTVGSLPDRPPRRTIAGLSPAQQLAELELLRSLAARSESAAARVSPNGSSGPDPAERLASWLLSQVDLSDVG